MIGSREQSDKKVDEVENQSMVGSLMKMLRGLTGKKKDTDKKRSKSSSSTSSSGAKKHKKSKQDKKRRASKPKSPKAHRRESRDKKTSSSESISDFTPLPIKIPPKSNNDGKKESSKKSSTKNLKQFKSNVKLLIDTYWIDEDEELEVPNLKSDTSIDEFIENIGGKLLVKDLDNLLASNGLKKGNRTKNNKIRAIMMHGVDEEENDGKDKKKKKSKSSDDE